MRPMMRWAVPSCCIIMLRWRFKAPNAGFCSAPASAAAASSCFLRVRFRVRVPRLGFLPERLITRASAAAVEASVTWGGPPAVSSSSRVAVLSGAAILSARGARGRWRLSPRAARRDSRSEFSVPFDGSPTPGLSSPEAGWPAASGSTSIGSRWERRRWLPLLGA